MVKSSQAVNRPSKRDEAVRTPNSRNAPLRVEVRDGLEDRLGPPRLARVHRLAQPVLVREVELPWNRKLSLSFA